MRILIILSFLFFATASEAAIMMKDIDYKDGSVTLKGTLVYDDSLKGPRPGVLVVPEWWGKNEYIKQRAKQMAEQGYVAFAVDMYGDGKVTTDPAQAGQWAGAFYKDGALMRNRALAGLNVLRSQPNIDKSKIAAIGFCFGGTVALELGRQGEDLAGVGVFHAGLKFPDAAKKNAIKAKILVMNGAADPHVPFEDRQKFIEEMQQAGADIQFIEYGGALHAFTNPNADKFHIEGIAYNEKAEKRSFATLRTFLAEIFGSNRS
jgi:dienelactone hydrolase